MFFTRICLMTLPTIIFNASLLNADVSVTQSRTTLNIRGDGASDELKIEGLSRNTITISINGNVPQAYTNAQSIKISMGKGSDYVEISDLLIDGSVEVNLGDNLGDEVQVWNSDIGGSLVLKAGSVMGVEGNIVRKNLSLQSGKESVLNDHVDIGVVDTSVLGKSTVKGNSKLPDGLFVFDSSFLGDVSVKLGGGDDTFFASNVSMGAKVALDGGKGSDYLVAIDISSIVEIVPRNFELFGSSEGE